MTTGDERCFLFSVRPKLMLYLAVGGNDNFQYLNINTETLPNGLVRVEEPNVVLNSHRAGRQFPHEKLLARPLTIFRSSQGMGGQFNYNGMWLAGDLLHGHSKGKPCSTFGSPQLSGQEEFLIEHVEV